MPIPAESKWLELRAKPARILCVDDDEKFTTIISQLCSKYVLELNIVSTIREAREAIQSSVVPFHAMMLDVKLTNGSGVALYAEVSVLWPTTHVVFLTGYDSEDVRDQVEKIGPARVHSKNNVMNEQFIAGLFAQWHIPLA